MENEKQQNQNTSSSSGNSNSGSSTASGNNSNSSASGSNQKNDRGADGSVLTLLQPHDMSRTVESALHVFRGKQDKLPELMQDIGNIIVRATKRYSTTQLILAAGALTVGAVLLAKYSEDIDFDFDE
jgi:hypothetical protein